MLKESILIDSNENISHFSEDILKKAQERNLTIRLIGGLAVWLHCQKNRNILKKFKRTINDIDFVGYLSEVIEVQKLFVDLGFVENKNIMRLFGRNRRIFYFPSSDLHIDLILDKIHFCHDIDLTQRLKLDFPTITVSDLLASKLQIFEITKKDTLDIIALLSEHNIGEIDEETINVEYLSELTSKDWGLWKTFNLNLKKTRKKLQDFIEGEKNISAVVFKIDTIVEDMNERKKSISWKLRNIIGERIPWHNKVEELDRRQLELPTSNN